jgi:hypothetical protein
MSNLFDNLDDEPTVEPSPFEKLFDIAPGSTEREPVIPLDAFGKIGGALVDPSTGDIIDQPVDADSAMLDKEDRLEDLKVQAQMDTIHAAAMSAFNQQQTLSQEVDPKFSARNSEVAAQFLNIALSAVTNRAKAKNDRQKLRLAKDGVGSGPSTVHNNLIVADRNTIMRELFKNNRPDAPTPIEIPDEAA